MAIFLFLGGLVGVVTGAQLLVEGALALARKYRISEFMIGLTVLTVGTSIPELVVSVTGALHRAAGDSVSDLVVSQIIGSGIANIGLILGLAGMLSILRMNRKLLMMQAFFLIGSVVLLWIFSQDGFFSPGEGLTGLLFYGGYMFVLPVHMTKDQVPEVKKTISFAKGMAWVVLGLIAVLLSGEMIVRGALAIAQQFQVPQTLIGLFLVGVGTSTPELVVTVTAAAKKSSGLSVGNVIGSNIFNILVALSLAASINGFNVKPSLYTVDASFLVLVTVVMVLFFVTKRKLEPKESALLFGLYLSYAALKVILTI